MKVLFSLLLITLGFSSAWCQGQQKIDSLKRLLEVTNGTVESANLYTELFDAYLYSSPDSANIYREHIRKLSEENVYTNGQYLYHSLGGKYHFAKSNLDSAFFHIKTASKIAKQLNNKSYLGDCYKKLGVIYNVRRNDSLSKKYAEMALANAKQTDDWRLISSIYVLLGNRSFHLTNYPEALSYYLKLDSIYTSHNALDKSLAAAYLNIGMIYTELRNPEAVEYIKKGIEVNKTLGLIEGVNYGEVALGTYYDLLHDRKRAIEHLLRAKDYYEEYGGLNILSNIYRRLGSCYLEVKDYNKAEYYFKKATSLPENAREIHYAASNYTHLGELYRLKGELDKAIVHFKKSVEFLQKDGNDKSFSIYLLNAYRGLYDAYKDKNDYKLALDILEKQTALKDSIQKSQNLSMVEELDRKYQNEKQQQEITLLTSQTRLAEQKAKNQRNIFIAGISILSLAFMTLFILFRNKQKTNKRLKQLESAKSKFFANISHEFRTPLTLISGPVGHQLSKKDLSPDDKTDLGLIQRNANRLLKLVDQILDLSKIEAGNRKLKVSKGNMELFLKHLVEPFQYQATQKGMVFISQISVPNEVWFDHDVVEKIVTNLLSNALKYNLNKGRIDFKAIQQGQEVIITAVNENDELTEKELPFLFNRFYQNNTIHQGFGIGLSLIQELVSLSHGTVHAHKPDDATIAFKVTLPVSKDAFSKADLTVKDGVSASMKTHSEEVFFEANNEEEEPEESSLPVLLVVDDNTEIRLFIKTLFKKEYQILEAENGEEGANIALKTIPDLIISDVMMPIKDGIYMSNMLKNDERTSHIPIVLLTARSGEENELTGLKTGADAYMVKPFKEEKLRVIIHKLITTRTAIQEKFSKQLFLIPKGIELTKADTKLMYRIQQILDVELTNPEFNAKSFSDQVGLSRMHLHRKLKALTGLTTSEFLRVQRLKLAAKLLQKGHDNISEVGYAVGFNQPTYFATAFKKYFGRPPSEYIKV
ncbi:response regulator [Muricauda sp. JGD-17]|uniref:histidine kinase n=1 Tax=Flagellimonas ochracea TaxID=2696472 RepID=A0A964TC61_9FLAO|nr:response regulator [Allomuricauda ochracea]NAY92172.1 response regulator [Allomuricauda ochracea]